MMTEKKPTPKNIDEYIAGFPEDVQEILQKMRETIQKAAPKAEETISYGIPTFDLDGSYLIYFAGYKKHVSLYPAPIGVAEFEEDIAPYASGQGTLKFPLDQRIPYALIRKIVKFRIKENQKRAAGKKSKN